MMHVVPRDLPSGTVTFLFTDVEGSTKLLHELGADAYSAALLEHRRVLRDTFNRHGGVEVDTQGDAFFVAFPTGIGAVDAALEAQDALLSGPIRVRIGIHTGTPNLSQEGYIGHDVHLGARIAAAGHGGQVLLSKETRELADVEATDLGEHRLKDFDEPISIFQLSKERFPPLKTISNTNLPHPASSFVGRDTEVVEVASLLQDSARLLTLTGPGGSGKTRLAIEAAATLVPQFKAGVFWVGLATIRDAALVSDTIAQTLGATDVLAKHIGERELLLLLDNLEQVVESAPDLAALVEACPNLTLLVTSRELLRVKGEVEYPVPPLAEPEAVELFCTRARAEPDETVNALCRALDNLPLALELAAARTNVLSPKQILERLSKRLDLFKGGRDADPRQATLRATIAWSHDLLSDEEQRLFARLAVFAGGCTLEAAEEIADAELDILQSLVDKSLVRHAEERFWMLETIRDFASERLRESADGEVLRRRHADHFLLVAEEAEPHLPAFERDWVDRLDREHDNLRAALDQLEAAPEPQLLQRLAGALARFWLTRGHGREGSARLERALAAADLPTPARLKALNGAAALAPDEPQKRYATEAMSLAEALGDPAGAAHAKLALATAASLEDMAAAQTLYEEAAELFRELGNEHMLMLTIRGLAWATISLGELERGRALHEENLQRAHALGNTRLEAVTLGALSTYHIEDGRLDLALPMLLESHRLHEQVNDPLQTAFDIFRFAMFLTEAGATEAAATVLGAADARADDAGVELAGWDPVVVADLLAKQREQLGQDGFEAAWERGRELTADEAFAVALEHCSLAE
jgi:predicted ATPase/class 3 adenylate cyclase